MADDGTGGTGEGEGQGGATTFLVGADGKFAETWRESLPDDLKAEPSLASFKDLPSFAKSYINAQRMLGKAKVAIPTETSTPGEWEEFFKAAGRPTTAGDYGLKRPKDFPEEAWDEKFVTGAQEVFHKHGVSKKAADAIAAYWNEAAVKAMKEQDATAAAEKQTLVDGLHKEWGAAYDEKLHIGNIAVEQGVNGDAEFKDRLLAKMNADPDLIRWAVQIGQKFQEDGIRGEPTPTPNDLQTQINTLMQSDAYMKREHPGHKKAVEDVQRLFQKKRAG